MENIGRGRARFTDDVLTEAEVIPDDNYTVINELTFRFGGIDTENPRAEVCIKEVK